MPLGTFIHNIELRPGEGAKLARSAGVTAQLIAKEEKYAQVKLSSGVVRLIPSGCMATIGQVSNFEHENISYGKAGRKRWRGKKSHVRGVAMKKEHRIFSTGLNPVISTDASQRKASIFALSVLIFHVTIFIRMPTEHPKCRIILRFSICA